MRGTNRTASNRAPAASIHAVPARILRISRTMPPTWTFPAACIKTIRSCILSFLFMKMKTIDMIVMSPIPPICIMKRMTICPNRDQFENVSAMTSPVTHVALVDVNRASTISVHWPVRDEIGRQSSNVPVRITAIKLSAMIRVGLILNIHLYNMIGYPPRIFNIFSIIASHPKVKNRLTFAKNENA